jgi:magnesium chelatase family protein
VSVNGRIPLEYLNYFCPLGDREERFLEAVARRLGFSGRARDRTLRVARTIADLDGKERIGINHLAEAVQFRNLDRKEEEGVKSP